MKEHAYFPWNPRTSKQNLSDWAWISPNWLSYLPGWFYALQYRILSKMYSGPLMHHLLPYKDPIESIFNFIWKLPHLCSTYLIRVQYSFGITVCEYKFTCSVFTILIYLSIFASCKIFCKIRHRLLYSMDYRKDFSLKFDPYSCTMGGFVNFCLKTLAWNLAPAHSKCLQIWAYPPLEIVFATSPLEV